MDNLYRLLGSGVYTGRARPPLALARIRFNFNRMDRDKEIIHWRATHARIDWRIRTLAERRFLSAGERGLMGTLKKLRLRAKDRVHQLARD